MDRTIAVTALRQNMKQEFDDLCDNHEVLLATRAHGENVVLLPESDYLSLYETAYLLGSLKNRDRLSVAINSKGQLYANFDELQKDLSI